MVKGWERFDAGNAIGLTRCSCHRPRRGLSASFALRSNREARILACFRNRSLASFRLPPSREADAQYQALRQHCVLSTPARFVEIGAYKGRSSWYLAERIAETGKAIHFDVVDTFAGDPDVGERDLRPEFSANLARAGVLARVEAHRWGQLSASAQRARGASRLSLRHARLYMVNMEVQPEIEAGIGDLRRVIDNW